MDAASCNQATLIQSNQEDSEQETKETGEATDLDVMSALPSSSLLDLSRFLMALSRVSMCFYCL